MAPLQQTRSFLQVYDDALNQIKAEQELQSDW